MLNATNHEKVFYVAVIKLIITSMDRIIFVYINTRTIDAKHTIPMEHKGIYGVVFACSPTAKSYRLIRKKYERDREH